MTVLRDIPTTGTPGRGHAPRPHLDRRIPAWLPILLAVLALLTWAGLLTAQTAAPDRLSDTHLTGTRTLTGRACVIVAADLSGSMVEVIPQRDAALALLFPWLKNNLRSDDRVMLVNFTNQAATALPLTPVDRLPAAAPTTSLGDGRYTYLGPALTLVGDALPGQRCSAVELLIISDGQLGDDPDALAGALARTGITRAHILNPNGDIREYPFDQPALAAVDVRPLGDSDEMSLTFGQIIAELTGQTLEHS